MLRNKANRADKPIAGLGGNYRNRYFNEPTFAALAAIEPVVKKHNLTLLETALRWCVHHSALKVLDGNDGIIIGVSKTEQLEGNLNDLEKGPLPEEVVKALDDGWKLALPGTPNYWHLDLRYFCAYLAFVFWLTATGTHMTSSLDASSTCLHAGTAVVESVMRLLWRQS